MLVEQLNQFSVQTVQALTARGPKYKLLTFTTGASAADSFPIDIKVEGLPNEVRVAQVPSGQVAAGAAVAVQWQPLSNGLVRIANISGLSANTAYEVKLALE